MENKLQYFLLLLPPKIRLAFKNFRGKMTQKKFFSSPADYFLWKIKAYTQNKFRLQLYSAYSYRLSGTEPGKRSS